MGGAAGGKLTVIESFFNVSAKAGIDIVIPDNIQGNCCGQPFSSKGFSQGFTHMANDTIDKLWHSTANGKLPVVLDITSCTHTLKGCRWALSNENKKRFDAMKIIDSIDYLADYILPATIIKNRKSSIVLHPVCSLQHMGLENKFLSVARKLADEVTIPLHAGCCGMAGDRGFLFPELTQSATHHEAAEVKEREFSGYYSSGKTCEMAMSDAVEKNYESIVSLMDECT